MQQTPDQDCFINCRSRIYCNVTCSLGHNSSSKPCQGSQLHVYSTGSYYKLLHYIHEDNLSAISMAESLKFTPRTKHIAIKYHHFCSRVQTSFNIMGNIKLKYISTKQQLTDIFTKPVDDDSFFKLHHMFMRMVILILHCFQGSVRIKHACSGF